MSQRGMVQKISPHRISLVPPKGAVAAGFTHDSKHQLFKQKRKMNRPVPNIEAEVSKPCGTDERGEAKHTWKNDKVEHPVCTVCGIMGKRLHKTHSQTGENIVARRKPHLVPEERLFYQVDCGNCNDELVPYKFPTDEDVAKEKREEDKAAMGGGKLGEAFVNAGVKPGEVEDVIRKLRGIPEPVMSAGVVDNDLSETVAAADVPTTDTTGDFEDQGQTFDAETVPAPPEKEYPFMYAPGRWEFSDGEKAQMKKVDALAKEAVLAAQRDEAHEEATEAAGAEF